MTESRLSIRWAVATDDAALLTLDQSAWTSEAGFPSMQTASRTTFFNERAIPDIHLVAELDGQLVGYLRLKDKYPFVEGAGILAINGFAVAPAARRLGVGKALLDAAEAEGKRRGARKLTLNVFDTNTAARRLYERQGYTIVGRARDEFLIDGRYVDDLSLAKVL
ncbi:MAG TPA: GNAT family N-acetyltransferase [Kribbella sp.]|nr:GNAT family N-acetyltransferase [Kribbella sp.]